MEPVTFFVSVDYVAHTVLIHMHMFLSLHVYILKVLSPTGEFIPREAKMAVWGPLAR